MINWAWENDCVFNSFALRIHGAVHSSPDSATDVRPKWHGAVQLFLEKFGDGIFADSNESSSFLIICQEVVDPFQLRRAEALQRMGIEALCLVQEAAWLEIIGLGTFERNICINFPTGAGKTLVYVLPIMQALVVLPTRDLAWQVKEAFDVIAPVVDFLVGSAVGKSSRAEEVFSLVRQSKQELYSTIDEEYVQMEPQTKIEILVAISGRLRDHINMTNDFSLKQLHYRVIHAPNRMFRKDFQPWLTAVIQRTHSMAQVHSWYDVDRSVERGFKDKCCPRLRLEGKPHFERWGMSAHYYYRLLKLLQWRPARRKNLARGVHERILYRNSSTEWAV